MGSDGRAVYAGSLFPELHQQCLCVGDHVGDVGLDENHEKRQTKLDQLLQPHGRHALNRQWAGPVFVAAGLDVNSVLSTQHCWDSVYNQ